MINILQTIGNFLYAVANLVLNFIGGIIQLLQILPSALTMVMNSVATMPSVLVSFAVGLISVSVVYLIIGR